MANSVPGGLVIDNGVIADLAGYAALESYGVVGMTAPTMADGIAKILPRQKLRRGIQVETTDKRYTGWMPIDRICSNPLTTCP